MTACLLAHVIPSYSWIACDIYLGGSRSAFSRTFAREPIPPAHTLPLCPSASYRIATPYFHETCARYRHWYMSIWDHYLEGSELGCHVTFVEDNDHEL